LKRADWFRGVCRWSVDDARCNITLVQSFTMTGRNTMNYARVTDLRHEATGQISGAVVKEAAKHISPENLNGKFIARQSQAIWASQSGCAAFDPFHLSRFAKGANVSRSLLADSGVAGVSSGRLAVVISTPTIEVKAGTVSFPKIDLGKWPISAIWFLAPFGYCRAFDYVEWI
jgi:hypothetical protein